MCFVQKILIVLEFILIFHGISEKQSNHRNCALFTLLITEIAILFDRETSLTQSYEILFFFIAACLQTRLSVYFTVLVYCFSFTLKRRTEIKAISKKWNEMWFSVKKYYVSENICTSSLNYNWSSISATLYQVGRYTVVHFFNRLKRSKI